MLQILINLSEGLQLENMKAASVVLVKDEQKY